MNPGGFAKRNLCATIKYIFIIIFLCYRYVLHFFSYYFLSPENSTQTHDWTEVVIFLSVCFGQNMKFICRNRAHDAGEISFGDRQYTQIHVRSLHIPIKESQQRNKMCVPWNVCNNAPNVITTKKIKPGLALNKNISEITENIKIILGAQRGSHRDTYIVHHFMFFLLRFGRFATVCHAILCISSPNELQVSYLFIHVDEIYFFSLWREE